MVRQKSFVDTLADSCGQCRAQEDDNAPDILREPYLLPRSTIPHINAVTGTKKMTVKLTTGPTLLLLSVLYRTRVGRSTGDSCNQKSSDDTHSQIHQKSYYLHVVGRLWNAQHQPWY